MPSPLFASSSGTACSRQPLRRTLRWLAAPLAVALVAGCSGSSAPGNAGTSAPTAGAPVDRPVVAASLA